MKKGFSLLEVLLVVGMMTLLAGFTAPLGFNFYRSQTVESARSQLLETLSKARQNAVLQKGDSRYGVKINTLDDNLSRFTLYKGSTFAGRDSDYDEVYEQTAGLSISA